MGCRYRSENEDFEDWWKTREEERLEEESPEGREIMEETRAGRKVLKKRRYRQTETQRIWRRRDPEIHMIDRMLEEPESRERLAVSLGKLGEELEERLEEESESSIY